MYVCVPLMYLLLHVDVMYIHIIILCHVMLVHAERLDKANSEHFSEVRTNYDLRIKELKEAHTRQQEREDKIRRESEARAAQQEKAYREAQLRATDQLYRLTAFSAASQHAALPFYRPLQSTSTAPAMFSTNFSNSNSLYNLSSSTI